MEVAGWLQAIGLPQYARNFHDHHVDEALLPSLTAEDLRDMGVASVGHRRLILNEIAALSKSPDDEPADRHSQVNQKATRQNFATGERRPVAVLFADLCGFTRLSEDLEDETLHAILTRYLSMAEKAIETNGGRVDKQIGDGDTPMRVNSRPNRVAERRVNAEIALRRSLIVARKHGVGRAKDRGLT